MGPKSLLNSGLGMQDVVANEKRWLAESRRNLRAEGGIGVDPTPLTARLETSPPTPSPPRGGGGSFAFRTSSK